jgi:hypothetical protein
MATVAIKTNVGAGATTVPLQYRRDDFFRSLQQPHSYPFQGILPSLGVTRAAVGLPRVREAAAHAAVESGANFQL